MATDDRQEMSATRAAAVSARYGTRIDTAGAIPKAWMKFVAVMKYALPASALLLAVTIMLWPIVQETEAAFTLSREDVVISEDKVRIENARYVGADAIDRLFTIAANSAIQDAPDAPLVELTGIQASIELDTANKAFLYSDKGMYMPQDNMLKMEGAVLIQTSDGNRFEARSAEFDLAKKIAVSKEALSGEGPHGAFSASSFEIHVDQSLGIFEGGVRMRIDPTGERVISPDLPLPSRQPAEQNG